MRYPPSAVCHIRDRLRCSNQRQQRRPLHRDEDAVTSWLQKELPAVKKIRELNATLALEDEAGFSLVSPLKRPWVQRGQTPMIRTSIDYHDRLNILGALLASPKGKKIRLTTKSYWYSLTSEEVIAFLKQLLRLMHGFIVLVWVRHPIHKRKAVQEYIQTRKRLIVFEFPVAMPNSIQQNLFERKRKCVFAGTAPDDKYELQSNVYVAISSLRTRVSQKRLLACLYGSCLDWFD